METIFPDTTETLGSSGALLVGWRRRPGSTAGPTSIEQVFTVVYKQPYTVTASTVDPTEGSLTPRDDGPGLFEGDFPGNFLSNGDFADGLSGWAVLGGAEATAGDMSAIVDRSGGAGSIRRNVTLGRTLRSRGVGFAVMAEADEGLAAPTAIATADGVSIDANAELPNFPAADKQPIVLSNHLRLGDGVTTSSLSAELPTLDNDGDVITYSGAVVATVEYESDHVAFKPQADVIVIVDDGPIPMDLSVDGLVTMSQSTEPSPELTGLGWEDRFDTPRQADGGDFEVATQPLPDDFDNLYFNGYRRDRRQVAAVAYPGPAAEVAVTRDDGSLYAFTLPTAVPELVHAWYVGTGLDDPCVWRYRPVDMHLDTLVVEPDRDHAYAVWRACWPVAIDPDGVGVIPIENNRRAVVHIEGGA